MRKISIRPAQNSNKNTHTHRRELQWQKRQCLYQHGQGQSKHFIFCCCCSYFSFFVAVSFNFITLSDNLRYRWIFLRKKNCRCTLVESKIAGFAKWLLVALNKAKIARDSNSSIHLWCVIHFLLLLLLSLLFARQKNQSIDRSIDDTRNMKQFNVLLADIKVHKTSFNHKP